VKKQGAGRSGSRGRETKNGSESTAVRGRQAG
jgi:hypothetical protein